jgi:predicted ATPase
LSEEQKLMQTRATALVFGGWALAQSGQAAEGVKQARAGLADWHRIGVHNYLQVFTCLLAESHMRAGQYPEALECLAQAGAVGEKSGERWWEARIHQARGQVLLCCGSGNREAAAESLQTAIHIARAQAARSVELRTSMSLARLWAEQGKRTEAHDLLAPVYGWFTEGFDTPDLKDARALLGALA